MNQAAPRTTPVLPAAEHQDRISREVFEQLVSVRGEGDEWDFKTTLGTLSTTAARINLAKDALAFCNLPTGGTIIVGVTDDYERVGLPTTEKIDTTTIRRAIEKYIDGDFIVVAAEHTLVEPGTEDEKRYGIIHFRRRFAQPVLAAMDGKITNDKQLFRSETFSSAAALPASGRTQATSGACSRPASSKRSASGRRTRCGAAWSNSGALSGALSSCTTSSSTPSTPMPSPTLSSPRLSES